MKLCQRRNFPGRGVKEGFMQNMAFDFSLRSWMVGWMVGIFRAAVFSFMANSALCRQPVVGSERGLILKSLIQKWE